MMLPEYIYIPEITVSFGHIVVTALAVAGPVLLRRDKADLTGWRDTAYATIMAASLLTIPVAWAVPADMLVYVVGAWTALGLVAGLVYETRPKDGEEVAV